MSTTSPQPDASPTPDDGAPHKRRNRWIWVSAGLAVVTVGLLVWALSTRSDLDTTKQALASTDQELETAQQELDSTKHELDSTNTQLDEATQAGAAPTPAA